jgi:hypothetical protein
MQKKSQVTLFFILALLILIVFSTVAYLSYKNKITNLKELILIKSEIPEQIQVVVDYINDCLEITSYNSLYYIGVHGGYYKVPKESSTRYFTEYIPYYYLNNKTITPTINQVQNEISDYIEDNLGNCLNINEFKNQGFVINEKNYTVNAIIEEKSVLISLKYPVDIQKEEIKITLNTFDKKINLNFKRIYEISKEIINIYAQTPNYICLTCINQLTKDNDVEIEMFPSIDLGVNNKNLTLFYIKDNKYSLKDKNFTMIFVVEN